MSGSFSQAWNSDKSNSYVDQQQKPHLENLWGSATNMLNSRNAGSGGFIAPNHPSLQGGNGMQTFGGMPNGDANVAGFDDAQLAAQDYAMDAANNFGDQGRGVNDAFNFALSSPMNPYTEQLVQQASRPVLENFQENVLPSIRSNSIANGGYSSRTGIAEGLAARGVTDTLGDISTGIHNNSYNTGMNTMMGALGMSGDMANYNMLPAQYMNMVGQQRQGLNQQMIDAPWMNLERTAGVLGDPTVLNKRRARSFSHSGSGSFGGGSGG